MASSAAASKAAMTDVERMMKVLGLKEEDLVDIVVDQKDLPENAARWMAVARVHTDKPYSQYWFYRNMRVAWDIAQYWFRPLNDNLYTLQFSCLGDLGKSDGGGALDLQGQGSRHCPVRRSHQAINHCAE